jgi:hypothetical protein
MVCHARPQVHLVRSELLQLHRTLGIQPIPGPLRRHQTQVMDHGMLLV